MPYVLIAYDHTDDDAPNRRAAARPAHLAGIDAEIAKGNMVYGGAMVDEEGQAIGSLIVTNFESIEDAESWLNTDSYITNEVWDKDRCIFIETKTAPAFVGVGPNSKAA
jgi:uncharacterized protein YciI